MADSLTPLRTDTTGFVGPIMEQTLRRYGLQSMAQWLSSAIIRGWSEEQIMLKMWDAPEFQRRFKGIFTLISNGNNPISPEEYISYENTVRNAASAIGYNITQSEIDTYIGNNVAVPEVEERLSLAAAAVYETDQQTKDELWSRYRVGPDDMMRYWMNPQHELPRLQQVFRTAEIAGQFRRAGYGEIDNYNLQRLRDSGMTKQQALEGAGSLVTMQGVFNPIDETEALMGPDQQIDVLLGDAVANEEVRKRVERRKAQNESGGDYAAGQGLLGAAGFATGSAQ